MNPKNQELPADQGELMTVEWVGSGLPDPMDYTVEPTLTVHPEGVFPEPESAPESIPGEAILPPAVESEIKRRAHSLAQLGKHSPLQRDGTYLAVRPGDVLPQFGVVTYSNIDRARAHSRQLEDERLKPKAWHRTPLAKSAVADELADSSQPAAGVKPVRKTEQNPALLSTRAKLVALRDDYRAGFLPATNREKNQAVASLDYIHNVHYSGGLNDQLQEIFISRQKTAQAEGIAPRDVYAEALVAVRSVVEEYGDYYTNALRETAQLQLLKTAVDACDSPTVTLGELLEDLGEAAPDPHSLVRYLDLLAFREDGVLPGFDPLRTREDRSNTSGSKHKVVEDPYTARVPKPEMQAYVNGQAAKLRVGFLRRPVEQAVSDQLARAVFWQKVLRSIDGDFKTYAAGVLAQAA